MGQLKHDGRATQGGVTAPAATVITKGDLYRINGWTGFALRSVGSADTVRTLDLEIAPDRVWYIKVPAGVNPAVGDPLYWTTGAGFKRGDTDLQVAAQGSAVAKVDEVKDGNGWCAVRALNNA